MADTDPIEEWREIPRDPRYQASSFGRVRRHPDHLTRKHTDGVLKPMTRGGYPGCNLGKTKQVLIHIVVCEAFHGPRPTPKHEAAHWDGDTTNSRPDNLRWATTRENHEDKKRHGTWQACGRNPHAKLTPDQVAEIRSYAPRRGLYNRLAEAYGVNRNTIRAVALRLTWVWEDHK